MKNTKITLTVAIAIAFSSSAFAGGYTDRQKEDILHGQGVGGSQPAQPYSRFMTRQDGFGDSILHNADQAQPRTSPVPYERVENDRDNSQDMIYS